jgi:periplasmic protein TonB
MFSRGDNAATAMILPLLLVLLAGCALPTQQPTISVAQHSFYANQATHPPPSSYPEQAMINKWEGTVTLRVVVGSDGRPSSIEVAQSSGHEILDDAAKDCVEKWTFRPDQIGAYNASIAFKLMK